MNINYAIMKNKRKIERILLEFGKILVSFSIMFILIKKMNFEDLSRALESLDFCVVGVVILLYVSLVIVNAVKWSVLLPETKLTLLIYLCFRSQFYSTILPGQLFGEASKLTIWKNRDENVINVAASVVFDRITGMIGQLLFAIPGLLFSNIGREIKGVRYIILFIILLLTIICISGETHIMFFVRAVLERTNKRFSKKIEKLYSAWVLFSANKEMLLKSLFWGIIKCFFCVAMTWYISENLELQVGMIDFCWIVPLSSFAMLIPLSVAGIGIRDISFSSMLSLYSVPLGSSLVLSSVLLFGQIISAIIGGIMIVFAHLTRASILKCETRDKEPNKDAIRSEK